MAGVVVVVDDVFERRVKRFKKKTKKNRMVATLPHSFFNLSDTNLIFNS